MTHLGTHSLVLAAIAALAVWAPASGSTTDNFVGTIAGTGTSGYSGDGGAATAAEVHRPRGIDFLSTGGLVYAEFNCHTVRRISPQGVISTLAGTPPADCDVMPPPPGGYVEGTGPAAVFKLPWGVAAAPGGGTVYVADTGNFVIRKIDVATGTTSLLAGSPGQSGTTDGTSTGRFTTLRDMAISPTGAHLYVVDGNTLRRVDVSNGDVVTIAGSASDPASFADNAVGSNARFSGPNGPTTDGSRLWVGDGGNNRIRVIDLSGGFTVATEAGSAMEGDLDGVGVAAQMRDPRGLALAADGFVYFVDAISAVVRRFDPATKQVLTIAGSPGQFGSVDGIGNAARFVSPRGMAIEGVHWAIADTNGSKVRGELPPPAAGGGSGAGGPTGSGATGGSGTIPSAPRLTLGGKATQRVLRQGGVLVTGRCDKPCTLAATGTISFSGRARSFALRRARRTLAAPGRVVLKLRLSRASVRGVRRALKRRKRVTATVTVRASAGPGATSAPVRRRIRARR